MINEFIFTLDSFSEGGRKNEFRKEKKSDDHFTLIVSDGLRPVILIGKRNFDVQRAERDRRSELT